MFWGKSTSVRALLHLSSARGIGDNVWIGIELAIVRR